MATGEFKKDYAAWPCNNLAEYLLSKEITSDSPAIWWKGEEINREEVAEFVYKGASYFNKLELSPSTRIIIALPDSPAFVKYFLGSICAKVLPIPISLLLSPSELENIIQDSEAQLIITTKDFFKDTLQKTEHSQNIPIDIIEINEGKFGEVKTISTSKSFNQLKNTNDLGAFWQYTSGSTGRPKAVMHYHGSALASSELYARNWLGITQDDRIFSVAKMSFGYGLGNSLFFPFYLGATSVLYDGRVNPEAFARILTEANISILFGVPSAYTRLLEAADKGLQFDFSTVRFCISAGEALPPELQNKWQDMFAIPIVDGIGSTEMLHIFISNKPDNVISGSLGKVVDGYQARVVDENGIDVATGIQGQLEVKGPSAMMDYLRHPDESSKVNHEHWIRTGDVFIKDKYDRFWFKGRSNEIFKVKGLWISPIEVENVLLKHEEVVDALVVGEIDENGLIAVTASIVPSNWPISENISEQLRNFVRNRLSPHKSPSKFRFVQELPTTKTGKKCRLKK